ncbi:DUF805 domain-containing protein [Deinococcus aetherius]|uniref:DUF805 domain-containing protein n=1 Tax=Deinococcus aetherius TaxID=200252 RepID=UPI0038737038
MLSFLNPSGRTTRKGFWLFVLVFFLGTLVIGVVQGITNSHDYKGDSDILDIYFIILFIPLLFTFIRRIHDTGRDTKWVLLLFVPVVGTLAAIVFGVLPGQVGLNKWGPDPRGA